MSYIAGVVLDEITTAVQQAIDGDAVNTIFQDRNGKIYKRIEYEAGAAAAAGVAGEVTYYFAASGDGATEGYANGIVTSDLSDSAEVGAGVLQAALTDGTFGWVQIKGAATLTIALTAGADGDPLTPTGAGDGTLDLTTAVTDNICAFGSDVSDKTIMCDFLY